MSATINLQGPSTNPSDPLVSPQEINNAVNAALMANYDVAAAAVAGGPFLPLADAPANVLTYGADPTGVADSSAAFAAALSVTRDGYPVDVYAPTGTYRLNSAITVGNISYAQRLFGDGWGTILLVGPQFSASANGVIIIPTGVGPEAQPSVCDLQIQFEQPPDFSTTTTATTAIGSPVLTLASVAGIQVGYYCRDITTGAAFPLQSTMPTVLSIAGNQVTLSSNALVGVGSGDVMQLAANRAQAVPLSSGPSLAPGSPAIQYPWAIYSESQSVFFDHILVTSAWNGIYIRGQTLVIGQYFVGCLNVGLDIDQCFNFPKIDQFMLWGWGFNASNFAMLGIYYDGQTIAANIGRCDDFTCDVFQSWCGIVNITSSFTWGQINQLKLDGSNSRLNIQGSGWLQIGKLYKTGGQDGIGVPIAQTSVCKTTIDSLVLAGAQNNPSITLSNGSLSIASGYMWDGVLGANQMIVVSGGDLSIDQMRFDSSVGRTFTYLSQTGGSVRVSNSSFIIAPGTGGVAFNLIDAEFNSITNTYLNGWIFNPPTTLGRYEQQMASDAPANPGVWYTNTSSHFYDADIPTTSQVVIRPTSVNAAEGKLRLYGSFATGSDTGARLSSSLRSGFSGSSWNSPHLDVYLSNGVNDIASDVNMTRMVHLTLSGLILGYDTSVTTPVLGINGAANVSKRLQYQTVGVPRWDVVAGNPESGGNSGSDMSFNRYDDSGTLIDKPLQVTRSSGITNILNLAIGSASGPTVLSGTGAPSGTQPKASIWMRTDGGVGTTMYVSQGGGVWNPVAGV